MLLTTWELLLRKKEKERRNYLHVRTGQVRSVHLDIPSDGPGSGVSRLGWMCCPSILYLSSETVRRRNGTYAMKGHLIISNMMSLSLVSLVCVCVSL